MPPEPLFPWLTPLREWQKNFLEKYQQTRPKDCLLVAVPGAGKTRAACRLIHEHLSSGTATHALIVCHSIHLMEQWRESAHESGTIQLCPLDTRAILDGQFPHEFHGQVLTYQTMSKDYGQLALHKIIQHHHGKVLVILDELHHAGMSLPWGVALENVFEQAAYRLMLSGTPFRTDGIALPFVPYDVQGRCLPFDTYTYAQALTDHVCRRIVFPKYDGTLEYWNGEEIINTSFRDAMSELKARERLNAAITSDWLDGVIIDADQRLRAHRAHGHADAGGLIVCRDDAHARQVQERVRRLTGTLPVLVTHREEQAHDAIRAFTHATTPWIVAVHMISEGVDIPRLRVGIYATNILTELYFWQFCGRFVRMIEDLDCEQDAAIFIPSDPVLITYAQRIYQEGEQQLRQTLHQIVDEEGPTDEAPYHGPEQQELLRQRSLYGTGTAQQDGAIFLHGEEVTPAEYQWACQALPAHLHLESALLAAIVIARQGQRSGQEPPPVRETSTEPSHPTQRPRSLYQRKIAARRKETELIGALRRLLLDRGQMDPKEDSERFYTHLQAALNRLVTVKEKKACTLEQLGQREAYLRALIRNGTYVF